MGSSGRLVAVAALLVAVAVLSGCSAATTITSRPSGATISVNGEYKGETPLKLEFEEDYEIGGTWVFRAEMSGYMPAVKVIRRERFPQLLSGAIPPRIRLDLLPIVLTESGETRVGGWRSSAPSLPSGVTDDGQVRDE